MNVIAFGLGTELLKKGSREYRRMASYAKELEEYHVIVLSRGGGRAHFVDGNLHVYRTGARTRLGAFMAGFSIAYILLRQRYKGEMWAVTSQDPIFVGLLGFAVSRLGHVPHVVQIHGDVFGPYGYSRLKQRLAEYIVRKSERVRVVSERIRMSLLKRGILAEKITVLPIRAELEAFLQVRGNQKSDTLRIVTISRLAPEKNISMLIRSFKKVHADQPHLVLEIVGSGPEERKLKEEAGANEAIIFTPWTNDVPAVMERAHIFAFPSDHEGYGLVLLEALASGVPVVTTQVGCVGELVRHDVHGKAVPVRDEAGFTEALGELIGDANLRETCGENGVALARELANESDAAYIERWVASVSF